MTVNVTLTFPEPVLKWIDMERGEIKRSTYVIKLLQRTHENNEYVLKNYCRPPKKLPRHQESAIVEPKTPIVEMSESSHDK
jgi:hypothetical protein